MKIVLIVIAVIAVSIWLLRLSDASLRRLANRHIDGRPQRSSREFGETFYPDHADVAAKVRDILAEHLPLDLARLEPSDRPVIDLKMNDLDSMSAAEFVIALEEKFDISIADADVEKMRTFDDICTHVIAKLKEREVDKKSIQATS